tara:strand:+ start:351 stop:506 length:156 start_codon:yes stop_codon:yes gene_type:complete
MGIITSGVKSYNLDKFISMGIYWMNIWIMGIYTITNGKEVEIKIEITLYRE